MLQETFWEVDYEIFVCVLNLCVLLACLTVIDAYKQVHVSFICEPVCLCTG